MNTAANITFAAKARDGGKLTLPVLFPHGVYDYTRERSLPGSLSQSVGDGADLTEVVVPSDHWMAKERHIQVNATLAKWLGRQSA